MKKEMLDIRNLNVSIDNKIILNDFNLNIKEGEVHVIMGPNGVGKSTLAKVIMGDSTYKINKGSITFLDKDLLKMKVDERSRCGIFVTYQHPKEIDGITNMDFLKASVSSNSSEKLNLFKFANEVNQLASDLKIKNNMLYRSVNVGFSGGEKKKNEILQMNLLKPKLVILDELDSGLDVDSLKLTCNSINKYLENNKKTSVIVITHYQKMLEYIKPDYVHVLKNGKIVDTGNIFLANKIFDKGFDSIGTNEMKEKN